MCWTKLRFDTVDGDWTDGRMASLAGESRLLDSFGPDIIGELKAGRTLRLNDIGTRSLIVVPLLKHGELKSILYLHCAEHRFWTAAGVAIAEDVAVRIADAIEPRRLRNLLNNAAKYTPEGGAVTLTVRTDSRHACVDVQDNGIGIEASLLPRIFDLFTP